MASQIKNKIAKTVFNIWQSNISVGNYHEFIECCKLQRSKTQKIIWQVNLPLKKSCTVDEVLLKDTRDELLDCKAVKSVTQNNSVENLIYVEVDSTHFIKDVLESQPTDLHYKKPSKKVIVEFSSPNIAKPFHVGHLRSTLIGNCIANIQKKLGDDVIKMNYLGDWGTQFGLIQVGLKLENYSEENFKEDPLKVLLEAYVRGNKESEKNSELYEEAKKIFCDLESGNEEITQAWGKYREWTIQGLDNIYNRLGVIFDKFEWESDYSRNKADPILQMLEEKQILSTDNLGRKVAVIEGINLPLIKSDNSTLYLMRDLIGLISRRSKYKIDEMYYVVDNGQSEHFHSLFKIGSELEIDKNIKVEHVKFGRIQKMSTRKGNFVPLVDVLNEAKQKAFQKQLTSHNTKVSLDNDDVADVLGVSSVIINDLKRRRIRDYEFSWDEAMNLSESTGISLQYCHCRLSNLKNVADSLVSECDPEVLSEPEILNLINVMARYEETLIDSYKKLEPCTLTTYLFELVKATNVAYYRIKVKRSEDHVAQQRSLLFCKSREILNEGMRLLGLKPLKMM